MDNPSSEPSETKLAPAVSLCVCDQNIPRVTNIAWVKEVAYFLQAILLVYSNNSVPEMSERRAQWLARKVLQHLGCRIEQDHYRIGVDVSGVRTTPEEFLSYVDGLRFCHEVVTPNPDNAEMVRQFLEKLQSIAQKYVAEEPTP